MLRKLEIPDSALTQSNLFLDLIRENKFKKLKKSLTPFCNTGLEEILEGLLLAANLQSWDCIPVMISYAMNIKAEKNSIKHFKAGLGEVLMIAVRMNQIEAVKSLFSYQSNVALPGDHIHYQSSIFYRFRDSDSLKNNNLWQDAYNNYTVLDWAVKNNNPAMCELLLTRWNGSYVNKTHSNYESSFNHYIFLSQFAYRLAMHFDYIDCAKIIACHHDWTFVHSNENNHILFKTLLHNVRFGVYPEKIGIFKFFTNNPTSISSLNSYKPNIKWATDEIRTTFLEMAMKASDAIKQQFFSQTINDKTALGSLYAANNPKEGLEHKQIIQRELAKLNAAGANNQAAPAVIPAAPQIPRVHYEDESDSSSYDSESSASSIKHFDVYSKHLRAYLSGFDKKKTIAYQINLLDLKPEEEDLFEAFLDPITGEYINIPVMLNETYYDVETLRSMKSDPFTQEKFNPIEIQSARKLMEQFEEVVKKLKMIRNKELPSSVLKVSNSMGFQFFSPVEKDIASVDQEKHEFEPFRWD